MTQKRLFQLLPLAFLLLTGVSTAQKRSLDDVLEVRLQNMGPIYQGNQLKGYFMLYFLDRSKDLYKSNFKLVVLDEDLNPVAEKKLLEQNDAEILEMGFNGSSIMYEIYSERWRELEVRHCDLQLKDLDKNLYGLSLKTAYYGKTGSIVPIDQKGFVYYYADQKYTMEFFGLKGVKGWKSKSKDLDISSSRYLTHNSDILLNTVTKKLGRRSQPTVCFLQGVQISNGKVVFEKEIPIKDYELEPIQASVDASGGFLVSGTTSRFNDKGYLGINRNHGIFTLKIDAAGEIQSTNSISFEKASSENLKIAANGKVNGGSDLHVRRAVHTSDGSVWLFGDIFTYSASTIYGQGVPIFHLAPDLKTIDSRLIDVDKLEDIEFAHRYVELSDDASAFSYLVKTTKTKGKTTSNYVVAQNVFATENRFSADKITLDPKADFSKVLPGKFGHILMIEYFKKDKKLDMRVEKFNQ